MKLIFQFSDNCSSGQSSQACTPNGDDSLNTSSGVGANIVSESTCPSSGANALQNINDQTTHHPSTKLSPTKTLIQKFNNIGLEGSSSNCQTEKQRHLQTR